MGGARLSSGSHRPLMWVCCVHCNRSEEEKVGGEGGVEEVPGPSPEGPASPKQAGRSAGRSQGPRQVPAMGQAGRSAHHLHSR